MAANQIEIRWKIAWARDYTDVLPVSEFQRIVSKATLRHVVRGPRGGQDFAMCRLDILTTRAILDYSAFPEHNRDHGMVLGVMELHFTDRSRSQVAELRWKGRRIYTTEAEVATLEASGVTTAEAVAGLRRRFATILQRAGQVSFRRDLEAAYRSQCCLSGCTVLWALNAAHIEPYRTKQLNALTNGLLLRSDLHALFDAGHLAFHPATRVAHFSRVARGWSEYDQLHRVAKLSDPRPEWAASRPAKSALQDQWARFQKKYGEKKPA